MTDPYQDRVTELLDHADIKVDGSRPWDITVHNPGFYKRAFAGGAIGLGESYMARWWDCPALDQAFERILTTDLRSRVRLSPGVLLDMAKERAPNLVYEWPGLRPFLARFRPPEAGAENHYEKGNDLYEAMLDPRMIYSCALWSSASTLEEAQLAKLQMSCEKLGLEPGQRVLDIGCGWGGFAKYAAERFGVSVVGLTISAEQQALAKQRCAGLPIEILLTDYRSIDRQKLGTVDRVASFGMFEHVGRSNFHGFLGLAHDCLKPDGRLLLETIGDNVSGAACNPWFQKYVFQAPTSMFPSIKEIAAAAEGKFIMEDWHNMGWDYAPTLLAWWSNLEGRRDWVIEQYGETFYRMWSFYLLSCAGAFASRTYQMWQILFVKRGVPGGFRRSDPVLA